MYKTLNEAVLVINQQTREIAELMKYQREMRAHLSLVEMENSKLQKTIKSAIHLSIRSGATHVADFLDKENKNESK